MENQDIRWKQRFENYFETFEKSIINYPNPSDLEKSGIIRQFGFAYEFTLNTMKYFLNKDLNQIIGPKEILELALQNNLIEDKNWLNMIESKSLALEIYNESILENEYQKIKNIYYPLIEKFYLKTKLA